MKKHWWNILYGTVLLTFTVYTALDTFVLPHAYTAVSAQSSVTESTDTDTSDTDTVSAASSVETSENGYTVTSKSTSSASSDSSEATDSDSTSASSSEDTSSSDSDSTASADSTQTTTSLARTDGTVIGTYSDDEKTITVYEYTENSTQIYVADVTVTSADALRTALANDTYGRNITATTSDIASDAGAVLAINGDYYGSQESGYVIRNGVLYRDTSAGDQEDLVIYADGSFGIINEEDVTAQELLDNGAQQVLSFGPALVENGEIAVTTDEEVGKAKASNPRTAIGVIDDLHYVLVVADGRTSASQGLTLYELAEFMQSLGVSTAYNLDGGGSSTMVFQGEVINNPTTNGRTITERKVSDIVYF